MRPSSRGRGWAIVVGTLAAGSAFGQDAPTLASGFAGRYEAFQKRKPACWLVIEERGGYSLNCPLGPEARGHALAWREQLALGWQVYPDWTGDPDWMRRSTEETAADQFMQEHRAEHGFYPLVFPASRRPRTMPPLAPVRFGKDLYLVADEERAAFCARVQKGKPPAKSELPKQLFVARRWTGEASVLSPTTYCAADWKPRSPLSDLTLPPPVSCQREPLLVRDGRTGWEMCAAPGCYRRVARAAARSPLP